MRGKGKAGETPALPQLSPCNSALRSTVSPEQSISKGPASISTLTRYSSSSFEGTRHEYEQVKPHPYSN